MSRRGYLILFLLGLVVASLAAVFQKAPGYMDAAYYYGGGIRLAKGYGFSELILWNYLDDPAGLPHASHAYWMPLPSLVAAGGLLLGAGSGYGYGAGRIGFLLLSACVPVLTAALAYSLGGTVSAGSSVSATRRRELAKLAGLLALLPGFYLAYLPAVDAFAIYMLLGAVFFLLAHRFWNWMASSTHGGTLSALFAFLLGILSALFHLTRADGFLWLLLALWVVGISRPEGVESSKDVLQSSDVRQRLMLITACLAGYLVLMAPWMGRNLVVFGTPLAPGGVKALWILDYDELFIYPASLLTPGRWLQAGVWNLLKTRLWALGQNLQTMVAVQGQIFLLPLVLAGFWRMRRQPVVRLGGVAWCLTLVVMTLVFPYAGARGGFFHSGAAIQPLFWALAPSGLEAFLEWGATARGWNLPQARRVFSAALIGFLFLLTIPVAYGRVVGADPVCPTWSIGYTRYLRLEQALVSLGAAPGEAVLVNDAPGYFVAAGRPALSIPYGDVGAVLEVAERYQARYLLLEFNQLLGEDDLYATPGDRPGLHYLGNVDGSQIYEITADEVHP